MVSRLLVFFLASTLHLEIGEAVALVAPSEVPKGCWSELSWPCTVSTGDRPRQFKVGGLHWELDRDNLITFVSQDWAQLHQGQLVLQAKQPMTVQTLFGAIKMSDAKVLLSLNDNKLEVFVLDGQDVIIKQRSGVEQKLLPGFKNWYTSEMDPELSSEVPQVIDIQAFAKRRASFFMNYQLGFQNELKAVAKHVKSAAYLASYLHQNLIERHLASIEKEKQRAKQKQQEKIKFNKHIRKLFLKKISYQD